MRCVVAHADRDLAHVGVDRLAQVRDRVDERDLRGEERVRRVLDHLRRRGVGDEHRRAARRCRARDTRTADSGSSQPITMRSGLRKSRTAWPSRRNSGFDATVTSSCGAPASESTRCTKPGRADRHRRLVDDDRVRAEHRRDLAGDALDERQVGRAVVALRRLHAEEHDRRRRRRRRPRRPRTAAGLRREPLGEQLGQAVLEDRHLALLQPGDPLGVDVGADHLVTEVREAGRRGQADVPRADDRDAHCRLEWSRVRAVVGSLRSAPSSRATPARGDRCRRRGVRRAAAVDGSCVGSPADWRGRRDRRRFGPARSRGRARR